MREAILVPDLGVAEMVLSVWFVKPGEVVREGGRVVELLLGNATFDVTAPASGTLIEHSARSSERVSPGQIVGYLETDGGH